MDAGADVDDAAAARSYPMPCIRSSADAQESTGLPTHVVALKKLFRE